MTSPGDRSPLWVMVEFLSTVFVVVGLMTGIYSGNVVLRAISGIAMVVLVSAATVVLMDRLEERRKRQQRQDQDS